MRTTRIALALALLVSPAMLSAQTTNCSANLPAGAPTCSLQKDVQSTVPNVLYLGLYTSGNHDLNATDSVAYHKTWAATTNGLTGTGTAVALTDSLPNATAADSVIVIANRKYILTIQASTDYFKFDKDASYGVCRNTEVSTTGCVGNATAGKPVTDLYWSKNGTTFTQLPGISASPLSIQTATTGERYSAPITFKSAWFYATDIPGTYKATVVYTVTGQ